MWVIHDIPPNAFNVLSDLAGTAISGVLLFVLGLVYPYLVWESVKHGHGVALDGIIGPPNNLWGALVRFRQGGSRLLLVGVAAIILVATLSHTASDIFLDFANVEVGSNDTYFLGTDPGDLPTYSLLGETIPVVSVSSLPAEPVARLLLQTATIVKGRSRFSILPPGMIAEPNRETTELLDIVHVLRSPLALFGTFNHTARHLPGNLQVQCQDPNENVVDEWVTATYGITENDERNQHRSTKQSIPQCDYESPVSYKAIEKKGDDNDGWEVLDWSLYSLGNKTRDSLGPFGFGARDTTRGDAPWIIFTLNETELALSRHEWRHGRRVRDGISLIMGLTKFENETSLIYNVHPNGLEFQVNYSVLSGPAFFDEVYHYTLSSWSRNCPLADPSGGLSVATFPLQKDIQPRASGCLIDALLDCKIVGQGGLFPQDNSTEYGPPEETWCFVGSIAVTLLSGIEVDPMMLAAYAGIAIRNEGINTHNTIRNHPTALNSVAAAYIVTREIVKGTVAVEGVRARVGLGFVCFMVLPLLLSIPLLFFLKKGPPPPVPRSVWDLLVLGRREEIVPHQLGSDFTYPPCPATVKYGIISDESKDLIHLGLGDLFVPLEHPLCGPEMEKMEEMEQSQSQMPDPPADLYESCEL